MRQLDERTLVGGQIAPEDVAGLKARGVTLIVNNRPDGEEPGQPLAADIQRAAQEAGVGYRFVPIARGIGPAEAEAMREAIEAMDEKGKMLAFCRSGTRSALAWALARKAAGTSREEIEAAAARAGIDLRPIAHLL